MLGWVPLTARMVRAGIVGVLESEYVQMAAPEGHSRAARRARPRPAQSLVPAIQAFALTAAWMPAGIVIVEYLFSFRGVGNALVQAVVNRDTATVEAVTLILATCTSSPTSLSDLATVLLTPRLRTRYAT